MMDKYENLYHISCRVYNLDKIEAAFAKYNIEIFGASSSGEITNEEVLEESIVVMLLEISRDVFRLNVFDGEGKTSNEVGKNVAEWAKSIYTNPAVLLMSAGLNADGQQLVKGFIDTMERQVPLFGSLAGDDLNFRETFVFNASQVISNGVVALVFDQNAICLRGLAVWTRRQ